MVAILVACGLFSEHNSFWVRDGICLRSERRVKSTGGPEGEVAFSEKRGGSDVLSRFITKLGQISAFCRNIAHTQWFDNFTLAVIVLNAGVLGAETYPSMVRNYGWALDKANDGFLFYFTLEIAIRLVGYGPRWWEFFYHGWNVFDFAIIAGALSGAYLPVVSEDATLLRLLRLLRVSGRLFTLMPQLRILVAAMVNSIWPLGSLALLFLTIMYIYGMVGWIWFSSIDPSHWGNIGRALLTMFQMVTVEGWYEIQNTVLETYP
jgi:voltage-gated sodium channel